MQEIYQKTVFEPVTFSGVGLHSGNRSKIKIYPAGDNHGIVFKRVDLKENNLIEAKYSNVSSAKLCTTLENSNGVKVSTVEHLLAAFYIAGIDNAIVEINCEEIPIMDGSAKEFLNVFEKIKIKTLNSKRKYLKIVDKVELIDGKRTISIEPSETLEVNFQLDYENKIIGKQKNVVNFQTDKLIEVSESRTFCLMEDIEKIKKLGLAKGGSLDNAVVVGSDKVLNKDGLRNNKEFVNHKILDLVGDFLLSGFRVLGKINCYQGGHELTNSFLRKLMKSDSAFIQIELETVTFSENRSPIHLVKTAVNA
tara:strand:- start:549 stop:1472 length:924 start_codon:yes stop_codon:yes gene_type:complete